MKLMKVFDCQDWDDDFVSSRGRDGSCEPFAVLDMIECNDRWLSWNIADTEDDISDIDESTDEDYVEENIDVKRAYQWVNAQILKECPDIDPTEEVLIKVWW